MPVMRGRGWRFAKQKTRCDLEGKQLAFRGASDKLSGREAPTAARSEGAPRLQKALCTDQPSVCETADRGTLQSLGKQMLKTEMEESRLGENGLPGWAGEPSALHPSRASQGTKQPSTAFTGWRREEGLALFRGLERTQGQGYVDSLLLGTGRIIPNKAQPQPIWGQIPKSPLLASACGFQKTD